MMSSAAIGGGGGVAAGSTVAMLQSAGVVGLGTAATVATTATTATGAWLLSWVVRREHPTELPIEEECDVDDSWHTGSHTMIQTIEKKTI